MQRHWRPSLPHGWRPFRKLRPTPPDRLPSSYSYTLRRMKAPTSVTVRQDLWLEAVCSKFPAHSSMAETYAEEQRFMRAVRRAFEERGLAPRDMIDVQSAL